MDRTGSSEVEKIVYLEGDLQLNDVFRRAKQAQASLKEETSNSDSVGQVAISLGVAGIGFVFVVASQILAARHVKSLTVTNSGTSLILENGRVFGQKRILLSPSALVAKEPAYTAHGPDGTEVPMPDDLSWIQRHRFAMQKATFPVDVEGTGTFRIDRQGRFLNAQLFDKAFYRA
ncbi:hypothetical protein HDU85_007455 [Gaertneriomyces sp. JEL0708]|nr:hypothetical protein HDU85_007455 [Gaertneriomyces sp. JEL0708]